MTAKELKKLRKGEMLNLILKQQKEMESLQRELNEANKKLDRRREAVRGAGSVSEARTVVEDAFEQAWGAAAEYVERASGSEEESAEEEDSDGEDQELIEIPGFPTSEIVEEIIRRRHYRRRYFRILRSTVYTLITVAAVAVLVAVLMLPVLQIYGSSMNPNLSEGDYVLSVKGSTMETGDIIAFYYNNKILTKRVIGQAGQWIDIAPDGTVYVDNVAIDEPYLQDKAFGECDLELPYQVPESRVFVMGDNRSVSIDSRSTTVGCVAEEQIVGKIVYRIWPISRFGRVGEEEEPASPS